MIQLEPIPGRSDRHVIVRPGALVRIVMTRGLSAHGDPCDDSTMAVELTEAHLTVQAVMHGKVSGYDSGIKCGYRASLVDPDNDVLA